ncbi:MAG: hypothetical protein R3C69_10325 [Geminicoccaceae bacterium]
MRDLAWRTSDAVGDGTSTAILAARAFVRAGRLAALSGIAPSELQAAIDAHSTAVLEALEAASCPAPEAAVLERVATQALGGDAALGALLAEAHLQAGSDGMVVIEEGRARRTPCASTPGCISTRAGSRRISSTMRAPGRSRSRTR